ncbi:YciI family protein [Micromonospora inositola]|uniref:YciI family protein n=1 Tax=Micromonospora inositola TaxID=47865 RepID=UPI001E3B079B|nr:YciI family protein [Micromonospora inositola]
MYATDSAHSADGTPEELEVHDRPATELEESGCMAAAFALQPIATATSIRGDVVTDGPFLDAKEVVAGFYVIEAPDLDGALKIARRNPAAQLGGGARRAGAGPGRGVRAGGVCRGRARLPGRRLANPHRRRTPGPRRRPRRPTRRSRAWIAHPPAPILTGQVWHRD